MDPAQVSKFLQRRWDLVEASKLQLRAERLASGGPMACLEVLGELRGRYLRTHPDGYTEASRREDLAAHVALSNRLRRASDALRRR